MNNYQLNVQECIDDRFISFIVNNDLSLTDVYMNSYLTRVNNLKRITIDWQENYSKILVRAYKGTINKYLPNIHSENIGED